MCIQGNFWESQGKGFQNISLAFMWFQRSYRGFMWFHGTAENLRRGFGEPQWIPGVSDGFTWAFSGLRGLTRVAEGLREIDGSLMVFQRSFKAFQEFSETVRQFQGGPGVFWMFQGVSGDLKRVTKTY